MKRTLITSALPYANGYIHLGHLAGAYLPADIYARFLRLLGEEVLYVCGSDEHGVAITISAEKEKTTPKAIIDKYHNANYDAFKKFGMSFDIYSRTSNELHKETAIDFFEVLLKNDYLVEKKEKQFYDEKAKMFLPDRYIEGTCPNCGAEQARGDQCDKCGAYYEQTELKNPISMITHTKPILKETTHWYLKLGMFQEKLEKYIAEHAKDWKDNVLHQAKGWLKLGLNDRAITRDLDWGVKIDKVPGIDKEKAEGKVLYVWFDAVLGYFTATREWAVREKGKDVNKEEWEKWWKDADTQHIAFIGKDNIVFHTIMLPAIEMAYGGFNLPTNVPANEFLNLEGNKFSKSKNWSIDLKDFIADFNNDEQSIDALRYALASILPEMKDSDFVWKEYQARTNNELAAILGNFVNRTVQFIHKYMGGRVPILPAHYEHLSTEIQSLLDYFEKNNINSFEDIDKENINNTLILNDNDKLLYFSLWKGLKNIETLYKKFRIKDAVMETMNIARAANKYFNDEEPWKSIKNDSEKCHKTLFVCSQIAYALSIAFAPIVPYTSTKIQTLLAAPISIGSANAANKTINFFKKALEFNVQGGTQLIEMPVLFNRVEDDVVEKQVAKLGNLVNNSNTIQTDNNEISIDEFAKIKLRTAKVLEAEKIKKSKKLLKLKVKLGDEERQIIAGIAEHYEPEYLIGKTVVIVANLKPAKLMGIESQGMVLCASNDGKLCFVTPEAEISDNAEVR
ncbi:MAG: methionine--tRNA ligase [Bacteroidetes bacterium]|nr:methionine--tRNA ligase [Bacteroidota bacterium]